uniref:Uncharacterized protein n=1 Tax=Leersia perrieri TaxID=77586 RepID=A0A0D9VCC8_9ORYZ
MKPIPRSSGRLRINFLGPALVLLLLTFISLVGSCTEHEKHSLLRFLTGLSQNGGLPVSWQNSTNCCTWEGIICGTEGKVIELLLASRGLEGQISPSLGELTSLSRLNLSHNSFSGGVPAELLSSGSIVILDVSFNRLNGNLQELNSSVAGRPLQVLNISSNSSPSFGLLDVSYNRFSGNIPSGIGKCTALRMFKAGRNNISGALPDELFRVKSLKHLSLANNGLQGTIDSAPMINLSNLVFLDLGGNRFSGKIPDSIGQLKRLEELHMDHNNLSGELPSSLGYCTNLEIIILTDNKFTGELAKVNFSNLPNLKNLELCKNYFTGSIPDSIYSCSNLTSLRLSFNKLHGQLTEKIENMKALIYLSFSYKNFKNITGALHILKSLRKLNTLLIGANFMHEAMPDDETIAGLENLEVLGINGCALTGKIPNWLSKLKQLKLLLLYNNQLSGPIPTWINSLNFLRYVDISNNSLTGEIPTALTEMPMLKSDKIAADRSDLRNFLMPVYVDSSLQYRTSIQFPRLLNLGHNKLSGVVPDQIGQLKALLSLNLSFNNLNGDIPQSVSNLTNLMVLDLSSNHLTGAIPSALVKLHFLSKFNVSYNDLKGSVPTGGQFSTFPSSSFAGNPKLCSPIHVVHCNSAEATPTFPISTIQYIDKVIFAIAFGVFFGIGALYDQIIISKHFG